jgi:hypothetical protein
MAKSNIVHLGPVGPTVAWALYAAGSDFDLFAPLTFFFRHCFCEAVLGLRRITGFVRAVITGADMPLLPAQPLSSSDS